MSDLREQLLTRLQSCIGAIAPGVVYTFPFGYGATPRVIQSDLGGGTDVTQARVYSKMRPVVRPDMTELPMVEILTAMNMPDVVTPYDDNLYERTMNVQIWGYVASKDAGDSLNSETRPDLNALLADLQLAVEAFPYWTDTGANSIPLTTTHGAVVITPRSQYTEPAVEQPVGILVLDYSITFKFHRLNP
jgi:hypothetical protein